MVASSVLVALASLHPNPTDVVAQQLGGSDFHFRNQEISKSETQAMKDFEAAAKKCLQLLSPGTLSALKACADSIFGAASELQEIEHRYDEEKEMFIDFWASVAKSSATNQLDGIFDLPSAKWLGNGKWGWVMMAPQKKDRSLKTVIKLCDVKYAHQTVSEYHFGSTLGRSHPNIVQYDSAYLYGDEEQVLTRCLKAGYSDGKLKSDIARKKFPEQYLFITMEFMNRGTLQNMIDEELLAAEGMLAVLQSVAKALAHLHENGVTHNDMKPENVLLHQEGRKVQVKLGDLGMAQRSQHRTSDITRYGMSALCMVTGEAYGKRKFAESQIDEFVTDVSSAVEHAGLDGKLGAALADLPSLLRQVFNQRVTMKQVSDLKTLQGWEVTIDAAAPEKAVPPPKDEDIYSARRGADLNTKIPATSTTRTKRSDGL